MKKFLIGCGVAIGAAFVVAVIVVVVVIMLGIGFVKSVNSGTKAKEERVFAKHYSTVPQSAVLPSHGTQVILTGTHPTVASADGRTAADSVTGTFYLDVDDPTLTFLTPSDDDGASRPIARAFHAGNTEIDVRDDGTVREHDVPLEPNDVPGAIGYDSPDGASIAYIDGTKSETNDALVVATADGRNPRVLVRDLPKSGWQIIWSLDGRRLFLYRYYDGPTGNGKPPNVANAFFVVGIDGKGFRKIYEEPEANGYCYTPLRYLAVNDALIYSHENRIESLKVSTGAPSVLWKSPTDGSISLAEISPDGTKLMVQVDDAIQLIDATTGAALTRITAEPDPQARRISEAWFLPSSDRVLYRASGIEDSVGGTNLAAFTSWNVTNELLYVINTDGTNRRQLSDRHIGLRVVDVYTH